MDNKEIRNRYLWENLFDIEKTIDYCMEDARKDERKEILHYVENEITELKADVPQRGRTYGEVQDLLNSLLLYVNVEVSARPHTQSRTST